MVLASCGNTWLWLGVCFAKCSMQSFTLHLLWANRFPLKKLSRLIFTSRHKDSLFFYVVIQDWKKIILMLLYDIFIYRQIYILMVVQASLLRLTMWREHHFGVNQAKSYISPLMISYTASRGEKRASVRILHVIR